MTSRPRERPTRFNLCGNTVDDNVSVTRSARDILVGDPDNAGLRRQQGRRRRRGQAQLRRRRARDPWQHDHRRPRGERQQGSGRQGRREQHRRRGSGVPGQRPALLRFGATPARARPGASAKIQPTECNTPQDGATIPGDLVVPENGVCVITNSTVGGNVRVGKNAYFEVPVTRRSRVTSNPARPRPSTSTTGLLSGAASRHAARSRCSPTTGSVGEDIDVEGHQGPGPDLRQPGHRRRRGVEGSSRDILVGDPLAD